MTNEEVNQNEIDVELPPSIIEGEIESVPGQKKKLFS